MANIQQQKKRVRISEREREENLRLRPLSDLEPGGRATIIRLAELPNVTMVKEATGSLDQASAILNSTNLTVLSGDDSLTLPLMAINLLGRQAAFEEGDDEREDDDAGKLDIPIHAFDCIVADECHRGYSAAEQSARSLMFGLNADRCRTAPISCDFVMVASKSSTCQYAACPPVPLRHRHDRARQPRRPPTP